jgi:hypothetical protein
MKILAAIPLRWCALFALFSSAFSSRSAHAGPVALTIAAGPTAYATSWRGDYGGGASLRAGARFSHVVAIEFQGWESYATVNRRLNTGLSFGIAGYVPLRGVRPFGRVFAIHQHEESLVSVENAPMGVLFGIGPGIRHRAGGGLTLGAEFPMKRLGPRVEPAFAVNANTTWFPDPLGPRWYVGLDLGVALDFAL